MLRSHFNISLNDNIFIRYMVTASYLAWNFLLLFLHRYRCIRQHFQLDEIEEDFLSSGTSYCGWTDGERSGKIIRYYTLLTENSTIDRDRKCNFIERLIRRWWSRTMHDHTEWSSKLKYELSFIHSCYFYSASSSPLLLRGSPDTARILCRNFTSKRHRQLWVKDLPKVPTRRLERELNPWHFGRKASTQPMRHSSQAPQLWRDQT